MATQEEVAQLRAEVTRLRTQVETVTMAEQGARAQLDEDLKTEVRAFHEHLRIMEQKFEEEQGALLFEVAQLKEAARESATAAAASGLSPQAFVASASATKLHLTQRKGFEGIPTYGGGAQWSEWRFTTVDWLKQESADFESLLKKIERLTEEPEEPEEGTGMSLGGVALTTNQQWCCDELYHLLARKTQDGPKMFVRNLESLTVSRGARAWYRIVREAEGQIEARSTELTEKLHDPHRKPVDAKDLVQAVEKLEAERREFEAITGKPPDEHSMLLALKRMLPKLIRSMLQTVEVAGYKASKEYVLKQAREFRNERASGDSPGGDKAAGGQPI
jgi:hypothetical protein